MHENLKSKSTSRTSMYIAQYIKKVVPNAHVTFKETKTCCKTVIPQEKFLKQLLVLA